MGGPRGNAIGRISEEIVEVALKRATDSGKIANYTKVNGQGYDFVIGLPGEIVNMLIEVKSSSDGRRVHQIKYGDNTPVIIVRHNRKSMSQQEREIYVFTAYLRIMRLVDKEMNKRRLAQCIPGTVAS